MEYPLADQFDEANFSRDPLGPSSRGCCKVINGNSCGSGSLVGKRNGKSLILTNSHVAGSTVGRVVKCTFPFLNNRTVDARVIMAGYSDRVMMDWSIAEIEQQIDLPHTKLSIDAPKGDLYSMGYPRCDGPWAVRLRTVQITHNGTVWQGQPNAIGGQSGSAIHSFTDNLQRVLLTWSWSGNCAGQTTRSIWLQYLNRAVIGVVRPEGLIELADNRADNLEEGFFAEANITTLPIWAHLDEPPPPPPPGDCREFRAAVLKQAEQLQQQVGKLIELARSSTTDDDDGAVDDPNTGGTFGL